MDNFQNTNVLRSEFLRRKLQGQGVECKWFICDVMPEIMEEGWESKIRKGRKPIKLLLIKWLPLSVTGSWSC